MCPARTYSDVRIASRRSTLGAPVRQWRMNEAHVVGLGLWRLTLRRPLMWGQTQHVVFFGAKQANLSGLNALSNAEPVGTLLVIPFY